MPENIEAVLYMEVKGSSDKGERGGGGVGNVSYRFPDSESRAGRYDAH